MLLLVLTDRNVRRLVDENVRRHEVRVGVEPYGGVLAILAGLFLELRHAIEPAEAGDAVEYPGELGVLRDLALIEENALLGIEPRGDIGRRHLADRLLQLGRTAPHVEALRDRVQVDDAIDALVRLLQLDPLQHGPQIVAEVQAAGRLHAGEDALFECHGAPRSNRRGFMARPANRRKTRRWPSVGFRYARPNLRVLAA